MMPAGTPDEEHTMDVRGVAGAVLALMLAVPAAAQESGTYLGAGFGQGSVQDWDSSVIDDGSFASIDAEDSDTGFRLFGGIEFSPNFALEAAYVDLGEATADGDSNGCCFWAPGPVTASIAVSGFDVGLLGKLPVSETFAVYGRLGLLLWDADITLGDSSLLLSGSDDGNDIFIGFGAEIAAGGSLVVRGDFLRYAVDDVDIDALALSLAFRLPN
jgi:OOP family OmpA-OmpF porin